MRCTECGVVLRPMDSKIVATVSIGFGGVGMSVGVGVGVLKMSMGRGGAEGDGEMRTGARSGVRVVLCENCAPGHLFDVARQVIHEEVGVVPPALAIRPGRPASANGNRRVSR
jgi:hypothetical protein